MWTFLVFPYFPTLWTSFTRTGGMFENAQHVSLAFATKLWRQLRLWPHCRFEVVFIKNTFFLNSCFPSRLFAK